jgi:multiple sugar transport system substrate-binding protein
VLIVCLLLLSAGLNGTAKEISFLTIAYPGELTKYLQDEVIPMFRRMHNADVSLLTANWNTRMERIIVLTAGGTPPDVVVTGFYSPYEEGAAGMLEPLNRYLERWPLTSRFSKGLWDALSWRGNVYVVPQNLDLRGIGYNKVLYAEAGLDPEKPPQSWAELVQYAQRLTRVEGDRVTVRGFTNTYGSGGGTAQQYLWFLRQAGLTEFDHEIFTSNLLQPGAFEALQTLQDLWEAGQNAMPILSGGFAQGREAMRYLAPISIRSMIAYDPDIMDRVGLFAPKRSPHEKPVAHMFANGLAITSASKNKDLAWEWIALLLSDGILYEIERISWFFSGRMDMLNRMREVQPGIEKWYALDPYLEPQIVPPPRDISQQELTRVICDVYDKKTSPVAALEHVHHLWNRLLAEWKEQIAHF